jgi:hypothetical protein
MLADAQTPAPTLTCSFVGPSLRFKLVSVRSVHLLQTVNCQGLGGDGRATRNVVAFHHDATAGRPTWDRAWYTGAAAGLAS